MTLVPSRCAAWLLAHRPHEVAPSRFGIGARVHHAIEGVLGFVVRVYERMLRFTLRHRTAGLMLVCVAFAASLLLYPKLGQDLFPQVDAGQIVLTTRVTTGTRLEYTEEQIVKVEDAIREMIPAHDLDMIISELGVVPDWSSAYTPNSGPQDAVLKIQLSEDRTRSVQEYADESRARLNDRFPGIDFAFNTGGIVSAALNYGALSPIDVQISGKINEMTRDFSRKVWQAVRDVPGAADVRINQRFDYPQFFIDVDRIKSADLGLNQEEIIQNVVTSLNSSIQFARNFWIDPVSGNQYWVGVQYDEDAVNSIDDLLDVPITSSRSTAPVLLRNVATVHRKSAPAEVQYVNFSPVINIFANAAGRDVGAVARDIEAALAKQEASTPELAEEKAEQAEAAVAAHDSALAKQLSVKADKATLEAKLTAAKADLKAKSARVDVAQADVERTRVNLSFAAVKAPFPGIITHRNVDTGAFINGAGSGRGEPLFTLARVDKLIVILRLPEKEAGMVRQGCKAHMSITALDGLVVEGTVSRFSRVLDDKSRTVRVEIDIDNKLGTVYPGMYGPVKVVLREMPDALTVPAGAVYAVGGKTFVVQVRGGKAYRLPVVTGYDDGVIVQIESGLKGNEEIVVSNKGQLAEGQPVDPHRVDKADANGSVSKR